MSNLKSRGFGRKQYYLIHGGRIYNGYKDEFKTLFTSEIELFPQVVAGSRGELRILQKCNIELFAKIVKS